MIFGTTLNKCPWGCGQEITSGSAGYGYCPRCGAKIEVELQIKRSSWTLEDATRRENEEARRFREKQEFPTDRTVRHWKEAEVRT